MMRIDRHRGFITEKERLTLIAWINSNKDNYFVKGLSRGKLGYEKRVTTRIHTDHIEHPKEALDIQKRIMELYNIPEDLIEKVGQDGMITVVTKPGGDTYKHTDPILGNGHAVRFNVVLQEADTGGMLYVDNSFYPIEEKELHCYCATRWEHYVTEVLGSTERMIWIFGFEVGDDWEKGEWSYKRAQDGKE